MVTVAGQVCLRKSKVMRELPLKKCPRLVIPLCFHTGNLMDSLLILNIGLCKIGVRIEGNSLILSMLFPSGSESCIYGVKSEAAVGFDCFIYECNMLNGEILTDGPFNIKPGRMVCRCLSSVR